MITTIDLAILRVEHFQPLVGQCFAIHLPEGTELQLTLSEAVADLTPPASGMRAAFSLIFRCTQLPPGQYIRQGCYRIENPTLGAMEILITPIQPNASGMRYQAVFA